MSVVFESGVPGNPASQLAVLKKSLSPPDPVQ
jgi:hypothetical protein